MRGGAGLRRGDHLVAQGERLLAPCSLAHGRSRWCYTGDYAFFASKEPLLTNPADLAHRIVELLADRQAEEIVLLDVRQVASFADYFVIASAMNPRQVRALVETLSKELRGEGIRPRQEGTLDSGWVLLDYGAIIVHLFSPEMRAFYGLEELWEATTPVVLVQ